MRTELTRCAVILSCIKQMDELQRLANAHCAQKFIQLDIKHLYYGAHASHWSLSDFKQYNLETQYDPCIMYADYNNGIQVLLLNEISFPNTEVGEFANAIVVEFDDSQYKLAFSTNCGAVATDYSDRTLYQPYPVKIQFRPPNLIALSFLNLGSSLKQEDGPIDVQVPVFGIPPVFAHQLGVDSQSILVNVNARVAADEDEDE